MGADCLVATADQQGGYGDISEESVTTERLSNAFIAVLLSRFRDQSPNFLKWFKPRAPFCRHKRCVPGSDYEQLFAIYPVN